MLRKPDLRHPPLLRDSGLQGLELLLAALDLAQGLLCPGGGDLRFGFAGFDVSPEFPNSGLLRREVLGGLLSELLEGLLRSAELLSLRCERGLDLLRLRLRLSKGCVALHDFLFESLYLAGLRGDPLFPFPELSLPRGDRGLPLLEVFLKGRQALGGSLRFRRVSGFHRGQTVLPLRERPLSVVEG